MTFEERRRIAGEKLVDFLDGFSVPRGLSPDAQERRISDIAEAFARHMPVREAYPEDVDATLLRVKDTFDGHSWPPQARFVFCMPKGSTDYKRRAPQSFVPDDQIEHFKKAMELGQPVAEWAVWGLLSESLPPDLVAPYRKQAVADAILTYRGRAHEMMRARHGAKVDPYFEGRT